MAPLAEVVCAAAALPLKSKFTTSEATDACTPLPCFSMKSRILSTASFRLTTTLRYCAEPLALNGESRSGSDTDMLILSITSRLPLR